MSKVRRRGRKESIRGFFLEILEANPDLLDSKSNEELVRRWKAAHPNDSEKYLPKIKQNLANLKSEIRRKERQAKSGAKPLRTEPAAGVGDASGARADFVAGGVREPLAGVGNNVGTGQPIMETLEESIDECLVLAKNLGRADLEDVIKKLRSARNDVVRKTGQ